MIIAGHMDELNVGDTFYFKPSDIRYKINLMLSVSGRKKYGLEDVQTKVRQKPVYYSPDTPVWINRRKPPTEEEVSRSVEKLRYMAGWNRTDHWIQLTEMIL